MGMPDEPRSHVQIAASRRRIPTARDLRERINLHQRKYDSSGNRTGTYIVREEGIPAKIVRPGGDQIYAEDTLRLEYTHSFQIRHREVDATNRATWNGRDLEIQAISILYPGPGCNWTAVQRISDNSLAPGIFTSAGRISYRHLSRGRERRVYLLAARGKSPGKARPLN